MVRCAESHPPAPWELSTAAGSHWKLEQTSRRFTKGTPLGQEISKLDQKQLLWLRRISNLWKVCALKNMSNLLMPVVSIKDLYDLLCISDMPVRVYVLWVLLSFTLRFSGLHRGKSILVHTIPLKKYGRLGFITPLAGWNTSSIN